MPVDCKVIQDLLPLYLDGVASEQSTVLVEEHLAQCAECAGLKEKMAASAAAPKPEFENESAKNPFRKLKKAARRTIIISVSVAVALCAVVIITLSTAGYRGLGELVGVNYDNVINQEQVADMLRSRIANKEGWSFDDIRFSKPAAQAWSMPVANMMTFWSMVNYKGQDLLCAVDANLLSINNLYITGYEFADYDETSKVWTLKSGLEMTETELPW